MHKFIFDIFRKSALGLIFLFLIDCVFAQEVMILYPEDDNISGKIEKFIASGELPKTIQFAPGVYHLTKTINLRSNISLEGFSSEKTILEFDLSGKGNCINIIGKSEKSIQPIKLQYDEEVELSDYFKIYNGSPGEKGLSEWGKESLGKIVVGKLDGYILKTSSRLRAFELALLGDSILCYRLRPVENVSISKLKILRVDESVGQTSNIFLKYAVNCLVSEIISENCNYSHVTLENTFGSIIVHDLFKDGFSHGNGGKAYGVTLQFGATSNEVSGCFFDSLRHGVVLQLGANQNFIRENYFANGFWEEVWLPKKAAGDIVLHGNYPYLNFIEGNICNNIVIDNSHGLNGPYNIIEHNLTLRYGIYMNKKSVDEKIYVFDNRIRKGCFRKGMKFGKNPVESCGNLINGKEKKVIGQCNHVSTKDDLIAKIARSSNEATDYFGITLKED